MNKKESIESMKVVLIAPLQSKNIHGEKIRKTMIEYFEEFSEIVCVVLIMNPIRKKPIKVPNNPKFQ